MMVDISHSLQTPLTVVKGELWNLKKQQPHQPVFRRLKASIDRRSKLTYDLLHLARLETISDNLRRERMDLSRLLREVVEYVDVLDRTKRITVVSDIEPHIAVWGDRKSLEELVTNLVSNALKYMSSRSPRGPAKQRERRITIALAGRGRK
jgi:signal transduction histidine kinase